ncbi:C2 domain-containing protein 5 [Orchesella cincta]|uniref:C2 domain-containing protein 5 n=1 Tax=Orchesella cincta TaxID=48709 RepID=A0A1D2NF09_ORCCI|nr:C2 domain-containing protein 5 [Orchesella cincta]
MLSICRINSVHSFATLSKEFSRGLGPQYIPRPKFVVEITPLAYIPGARIEKYLGNLNFFFIRETTSIRENGGLSGFVHNFVAEVLAIVRAHVAALGGNAMVSYFMTELALLHNPHKNQGQCLINVGGDVVLIVHPSSIPDDAQMGS